ncbi:FCGR3 protein, partial [Spizella passerina]|nr:FCGR3 protein [Spizella passerina]
CPPDWLVLQVPAQALLEGDTVTLHFSGWQNNKVTLLSFCREEMEVGGLHGGTELVLSPLQQHHSSNYNCKGQV